ncbi:MAG: hypothetical protein DRJ46_01725 [Thermoprotei archaeon]|nr:MAG: hypothetical protein DRJ46_01725 [Thermoprotei archaeon]
MEDILLIISFLLALYVAWSVGANDETMAVAAGSGFSSITIAVVVGALMDFLGAVIFSERVESTLGKGIVTFPLTLIDVFIITSAMATWLVLGSYKGWPISTTHSVVGAAIGLALFKAGIRGVNWQSLGNVAGAWILSPFFGMMGSYLMCKLIDYTITGRIRGMKTVLRASRAAAIIVFAWAAFTSFSRGGNDVANATAFLVTVYPDPLIVRLIGGAGMALGLVILGRRVVKNVGNELVEITPLTGLAVQVSVALILFVGTFLGLPLSGTHILVGAVIGVGLARGIWVNIKGLKEIAATWIATFPGAGVIAVLLALTLKLTGYY